jgi:hypothetical protein
MDTLCRSAFRPSQRNASHSGGEIDAAVFRGRNPYLIKNASSIVCARKVFEDALRARRLSALRHQLTMETARRQARLRLQPATKAEPARA